MGELHTGQGHTVCVADHDFYIDLHVVPPGFQSKGEGDYGYLAQSSRLAPCWWGSLVLVGCPPKRMKI